MIWNASGRRDLFVVTPLSALTPRPATGHLPAETGTQSTNFEGTSKIQRTLTGRAVTGLDISCQALVTYSRRSRRRLESCSEIMMRLAPSIDQQRREERHRQCREEYDGANQRRQHRFDGRASAPGDAISREGEWSGLGLRKGAHGSGSSVATPPNTWENFTRQ